MDFDEYLSHNEELYASPSDPYWPPIEASTEIGPQIGLGATEVDHQLPKTLSSGDYSCDPWPFSHVASAPCFDLMPLFFPPEPATPPLTVNLFQLVVPSGPGDQAEHISPFPPPLLSFLFLDPQLDVKTLAGPPAGQSPLPKISKNRSCKQEYALSPDLSFGSPSADSSSDEEYHDSASDVSSTDPTIPRHVHRALSSQTVAVQSGTEVVSKLNGHPVLRYPNDSYRCMSIVTAGGKVSQYTRKSERPPNVGQPCGQTFRGRDEIVRHLKTSRWHRKLDECKLIICEVCGQQLSRKDALGRHMRTLHLKHKEQSTAAHSKRRASNNKSAKQIPKAALRL